MSPPQRNKQANRPRGFTLVELLFSIGIIAILIAMLLPILASIANERRFIQCASNLRSLHAATMLYMDSNNGLFPLIDDVTTIPGSCTSRRSRQGPELLADYLDALLPPLPPENDFTLPWPYYSGYFPTKYIPVPAVNPFRCPADNDYGPRTGFSYEFPPAAQMLNLVNRTPDIRLQRIVTLAWEQNLYGPTTGPVWIDVNLRAHRNAPPGQWGTLGVFYDGSVRWARYYEYQVPNWR